MKPLGLVALAFGLCLTSLALAETSQESYAAALAALEKGADNEAIDRLELLADQGLAHPDASLARAAAYIARAEGKSARPGDLGRAAAALSEALLLRPGDAQAERGLDAVHAEIARRQTRQGENVVVRPRLSRAIVALLPEQAWAILAALGSLVLSAGIVIRRAAAAPLWRLTGAVAIGVGIVLGSVLAGGALAAHRLRVTSQPAVVVVTSARLSDENGRPLPSKRGADTATVPEGGTVYVRERREGRYLVEWGSTDGWLGASDVRLLAGAGAGAGT
ncbi:MAG TPA: hypothetical protein VJN18_34910 [Polyangiaceae bacterium]|nr:hypothetical protein [Polyangiaceae bacterium]